MTCAFTPLVDAHFARKISTDDEQRLRGHLPGCDACRARYDALRVVDRAVAGPDAAKDRLGAALGFAPPPKPRPLRWVGAFAAAALAAGIVWVGATDGGFTARGGGAVPAASIEVYRIDAHGDSQRTRVMKRGEALAFAYRNAAQRKYVMIFGRTALGQVFWFYPAWTSGEQTPTAIPALPGDAAHELPEAIRHPLPSGQFTVYGLFLDRDANVREVEAALPDLAGAFPGADVFSVPIVVVP